MAGSRLNAQLGDTHLNPEELVVRERESLLAQISNRKPYGQDELDKPERSQGPRLYYSVFLRKLRKIYPALLVKDGIPGHVALYRPKTESEMVNDGYDLTLPKWRNEHEYFGGLPKDFIPEWGHYLNDTDGIAEKEVRGWRSVLIAMFKQKLITYEAASAQFGDPENDQRSKFYMEQTKENINVGN